MWRQKKNLASWEATLALFHTSWLLLSENPNVHPKNKKRTAKPGDAFEKNCILAVVWKCQGLYRSCSSLVCETSATNRFLASSRFRYVQFPSSYASINRCFTAGKIPGVGNCHAAWPHQKTTVCTSIVYGTKSLWGWMGQTLTSHLSFRGLIIAGG